MKKLKFNDNGVLETKVKSGAKVLDVQLTTKPMEAYKLAVEQLAASDGGKGKAMPYEVEIGLANKSKRIIGSLHAVVFTNGLPPTAIELPDGQKAMWRKIGDTKPVSEVFLSIEHLDNFEVEINFPGTAYLPENYVHLINITGLSNSDFCREFNIHEQTFYKHKSGLRTMKIDSWVSLVDKVKNFLASK